MSENLYLGFSYRIIHIQTGPISSKLSKAHAAVVPRVAQTCKMGNDQSKGLDIEHGLGSTKAHVLRIGLRFCSWECKSLKDYFELRSKRRS